VRNQVPMCVTHLQHLITLRTNVQCQHDHKVVLLCHTHALHQTCCSHSRCLAQLTTLRTAPLSQVPRPKYP
jgi:hypothetical protein